MAEFNLEPSFNNLKPGQLGKISLNVGEKKTINIAAKKSLGQLELFFNQFTQSWKNVKIGEEYAWVKVSDFRNKLHLKNLSKLDIHEIIGNKEQIKKKATQFEENNREILANEGYKSGGEFTYLEEGKISPQIVDLLKQQPRSYIIIPRKTSEYDAAIKHRTCSPLEGEYYYAYYNPERKRVSLLTLSVTSSEKEKYLLNGKPYDTSEDRYGIFSIKKSGPKPFNLEKRESGAEGTDL